MNCPKCNHIVKDTAKFCENCGAKIEVDNTTIECPSCHARIPKDSKFCPDCGKEINTLQMEYDNLLLKRQQLSYKIEVARINRDHDRNAYYEYHNLVAEMSGLERAMELLHDKMSR